MRTSRVGALVVLGLLCAGESALADPPAEPGQQLVESRDPTNKVERLACGSQFCVWHVSQYMGGCSGDDCNSHDLVVSDLKGRALEASTSFAPRSTVRFLGPRQIELVTPRDLITRNPGGKPWDAGIGATLMQRRLLTLSPDGGTFVADSQEAWFSPERHKKLQRLLYPPGRTPEEPGLKSPVPGAVLAKALAVCVSEFKLEALHHECRKGTCLLVLGEKVEEGLRLGCALEVKAEQVRRLPIDKLIEGVDQFSLDKSRLCFVWSYGGIRGQPGDEQCVSRAQPGRMAFVETQGLHLESGEGYPVRKAGSVAAGRELAPTVHAFTAAHVRWGRDAWRGEKDLSLTWQALRAGDALELRVEVDDDVLVPFDKDAAVHTDHLELDFRALEDSRPVSRKVHLKLGVLLAAEGKARFRLWKREAAGKVEDLDEEYAATGTWTRTERGYTVNVSLPIGPLSKELGGSRPAWKFSLMASDADEKGRQKTLLGTEGTLRLWDEYPPTIEEYLRTVGHNGP
jgi:hypothetical protein